MMKLTQEQIDAAAFVAAPKRGAASVLLRYGVRPVLEFQQHGAEVATLTTPSGVPARVALDDLRRWCRFVLEVTNG